MLEAVFFRAARLGRARPGGLLAGAVQGLPGPVEPARREQAATPCRAWPSPPSAAPWSASARTASRCARPSPGSTSAARTPAAHRLVVARGVQAGARRRHHRLLPRRGRDQLDQGPPAGHLGRDRQIPAAVRLPELAAVRALRRFQRLAGGLSARSTTSAAAGPRRATGNGRRWRSKPRMLPELVEPGERWARSRRRRPARPASRRARRCWPRPPTRPAR
jgi:hypothetical protein